MRLPLATLLRRGVVFLWHRFSELDDPSLEGHTKAKFIVVLSSNAADDPFFFVLTTSLKAKHQNVVHPEDFLHIPAGSYDFFQLDTLINVAEAGQFEIGRAEFMGLYESDEVTYKGRLSDDHTALLVSMIARCPRVSNRFKAMLTG